MKGDKEHTDKIALWLSEHLSERHLTILLAFAIGFLASVAAIVLHFLIRQIQQLLTDGFYEKSYNWLYLVFPIVGIYITSLFVRYVVKDNISHGITRVLYAISTKRSRLKRHNCWTSVVASAITIGFGGSVGAEAPIVLTGSAIGSNLGQRLNLDNKTLMLLVGCGAAAAIAGIFKAPIAGLVFTLEVLMVDLTMASLMPILISSVTATCFTYLFLGEKSLFNFTLSNAWRIDTIPADILLGVSCAVISLYFIRMMNFTEGIYSRMKDKPYAKLALGGITLSLLIFLFPSLYGEGYNSINILLNGKNISDWQSIMNNSMFYGSEKMLIVYIALVLLTKVFATSATNGGGGVGGTFAPSLFIGAYGGFLFARLWNTAGFGVSISESNFTMLGMAGVIAGVMHAPLTGIFLIAEITGGYDLFMPLIIVSIVSVMATGIFEPHSIYATRLARQGRLVTHHTDSAVLTLMNLNSVIEKQYNAVGEDMPLGKLVKTISRSDSGFIPVTDTGGTLLGEVDITKIRHIMFRTELYQRFTVSQVMTPPPAVLTENDPMQDVMRAFEETNAIYLPVTDMEKHLIGYISRVRLFDTYRKMVADMSSE